MVSDNGICSPSDRDSIRYKEYILDIIKNLFQFCAKEESLKSELGSDLVSQLTIEEQRTVDNLNDTIERITQDLKDIIKKRVEVNTFISINQKKILFFLFIA